MNTPMVIITNTDNGTVHDRCTLSQFCEENSDDPATVKQVTALAYGESITLGGGAIPAFRITKQRNTNLVVTDANIETAIAVSNFEDLQSWGIDEDIWAIFSTEAEIEIEEVSFEEEKEKCQWRKQDGEWVFYLVGFIIAGVEVSARCKKCKGKVKIPVVMPLGVTSYPALNNG